LVLALALVHHLAIGHSIPLVQLADWLQTLSDHLLIEFVPKTDPQTQRLLLSREDVFGDYTKENFEQAFGDWFEIVNRAEIRGTDRALYLMHRKG
jgi:hypothetical protein